MSIRQISGDNLLPQTEARSDVPDFVPRHSMAPSIAQGHRADTLDGFLREMKTRFPEASAKATLPPDVQKADPFPTGSLPRIVGMKKG